jgi:hypothetical protein
VYLRWPSHYGEQTEGRLLNSRGIRLDYRTATAGLVRMLKHQGDLGCSTTVLLET